MTEKNPRPLIAITMGDPAGVRPEIILKALNAGGLPKKTRFVVIGDRGVYRKNRFPPGDGYPSDPHKID